ncbi:MAG: hypothetical protein KAG56_05920, partial [Sulfurovaceae bacterium]|nr:hypothetical protein [Sulfurovaceae bacterium]
YFNQKLFLFILILDPIGVRLLDIDLKKVQKIVKKSDICQKMLYTSLNLSGSTTVLCGPTLSI